MKTLIQWTAIVLHCLCTTSVWSEESTRITPAVRVIDQIQSAVVPTFTLASNNTGSGSTGSGAVFHESGFILTADHVSKDLPGVALFGLHRAEYEVVGRVPQRDLAVLKVRDTSRLKSAIRMGRSNDLRIGEPIIVGGNPGGRGIVYSQGTINSSSIEPSWPNILVKSYWRKETDDLQGKRERSTGGRPDFIQFDAVINKGNSGGPVVNFEGALIGLVALKNFHEEGTSWAIPVDRIRMFMPYLIPSEEIGGFEVGLEVDMLADKGLVVNVLEGSSAWDAGIRSDDVILKVENQPIRQGHEWLIALWGRKPGDRINVEFSSATKTSQTQLELRAIGTQSTVIATEKEPGVSYKLYDGLFSSIPDYKDLKPVNQGIVDKIDLNLVNTSAKLTYSIVYSGYIEFEEAGLVRIGIGSDDASKLYLNNKLLIDNDLAHPFQTLTRWDRVPRGLVPFRIESSEVGGDRGLTFTVSHDIEGMRPVTLKLFTDNLEPAR